MENRRKIGESKMMRSLFGLYGEDPEARQWLVRLSIKARRNHKVRKKILDLSGFAFTREKLERKIS